MNVVEQLKSRWQPEWTGRPDLARLHQAFIQTIHFIESVPNHRADLAKPGDLSAKGLNDAVRKSAAANVVPALRKVAWEAEKTANGIKNDRRKLAVPTPDKSDIVGALLRQELRTFLRGMEHGERVGVVMSDAAFLEAAMEGPAALSGLTDKLRAELENRMIESAHGAAVEAMDSAREAISLTESAVEFAVNTLRDECGFEHNKGAFNEWMAQASVEVEREIAAEKSRYDKPKTAPAALTSPANKSEVAQSVEDTLNEIFAKGFPDIYPDHPANKAA